MNKEAIYNFLDEYVGEGANCHPIVGMFRTWSEKYVVTSNNETEILWFIVRADEVKVYKKNTKQDLAFDFWHSCTHCICLLRLTGFKAIIKI